ncbi:universal stress protein [Salinibacter sp. 10B]|uniref:universal stress protein n=1 Tax=Salinibacter sp. 10B TaxID=1923971 RepID=UPI0011B0E7E6|nr:universal stress protein [Salinibacter sp. 10B]
MIAVRSVLAATDLTEQCTSALQAAAVLSRAFDASLHVVHVGPLGEDASEDRLADALQRHVHELLGTAEGIDLAVEFDRPFHGILVRAAAVHADLIVMGPHRGTGTTARWRGTTAERVVRSADVPCLVVSQPFALPLRHVAVPVDFSPATRGAAWLAAEWLPFLSANAPEAYLSLVYVSSEDDESDRLAMEWDRIVTLAGPEASFIAETRVEAVVCDGPDPVTAVSEWTAAAAVDLLVVPAEARRGLKRLWTGSPATELTLQVACPTLLVPPALWRRAPLRLRRVATAALGSDSTGRFQEWMTRHLPTLQEGLSLTAVNPEVDLVQEIRKMAADLLVVSTPEDKALQRSTVERLLERTPIPVLLLREPPSDGIRHILVAVDTGDIWYEKFGWAKLLLERYDAEVTIFHAIDLSMRGRVRREPGGEFVPGFSAWTDNVEATVVPAMETWLEERVRLTGLPVDRVNVMLGLQDPWFAVPNVAARVGADLVIVAAHSESRAGRVPLSRVVRSVLTQGQYSVLAVIDRARRLADRRDRRPIEAAETTE